MHQSLPIHFSRPTGSQVPKLRWPSVESMRARYQAQGMSPVEVEAQVQVDLKQRDKVRAVALDFEAHFVSMLLKEMNKTVEKNELFHGGAGEDMFTDMLADEQAKAMVSQGKSFGLADMVEQSMISRLRMGESESPSVGHIRNLDQADPAITPTRDLDTSAGAMNRVRTLMRQAEANLGWGDASAFPAQGPRQRKGAQP